MPFLMVSNLPWSTLKSSCILPALFSCPVYGLVFLFFSLKATAQNIPSSKTNANAVEYTGAASIDRLNNVYLVDRQNNLYKFNSAGQLTTTYSPPAGGHLALVEAWNAAKILLF